MELKTQYCKPNRLKDVNKADSSHHKKKTKERKELWDSLIQVYEEEAGKENVEDVSVADIEQWTISHPSDSPRAFPLINPTIVFNALPGTVADFTAAPRSKCSVNLKQVAQGKKRKKDTSFNKSSNGQAISKSKKKSYSTKNKSKRKLCPENSLTADIRRNFKKDQKLKLKVNTKKSTFVNDSVNPVKRNTRKSIKSDDIKVPVKQIRLPLQINEEGLKHSNSQHICNLTISYYNNEEIPSTRYDGRKPSKSIAKESEIQNTLLTEAGLQHKDNSKMKSKKKTKSRHSKNALAKHSNVSAGKPLVEESKDKFKDKITHKYKPSLKYFEALSRFGKEENNNAPVVILHHRGEKPFQKSKEHISVDNKHLMSSNPTHVLKDIKVKKRNESVDNRQSKCKEKDNGASNFKDIKPTRDKNGLVKCAMIDTPNANAEPNVKCKIKKRKHPKQVFPVVDSTSNTNDQIMNQMKSLPIRIEDNPLTFMNLFRTAHVFNGYKNHKKFDNVIKLYCEKLKQEEKEIPKDSLIPNSSEGLNQICNTESLKKLYMNKKASSKLLNGAGSRKRLKKSKTRSVTTDDPKKYCLHDDYEKIPESLNNLKSKKDHRKKRTKFLTSGNPIINKTLVKKLETLLSKEKVNTIKENKKYLRDGDYFKDSKNYRPECGDGLVGEFSSQPSNQNNKLSTIYSESIGMAEKDSTEIDQLNVDSKNYGGFEISSKSNTTLPNNATNDFADKNFIQTKDIGKISILKPTVSGDGKKLTFQLVKADFVPKNTIKLNKQTYRLDKKRKLKASKESLSVKKDKLMLFYTKRESSCTSKDSLNIAISRDTVTSNNGSSNKVLNVVIKQTNSLTANSKTSPPTDLDLENLEDCQGINDFKFKRKNIYEDGNDSGQGFYGNDSVEFGCQTYEILAGNQAVNSFAATNSHEVDSKQSIIYYQMNVDQQKCLNNSEELGFCCLQHNPEVNNKIALKNSLGEKILNLKSLPSTFKTTKLPQYKFVPGSNSIENSKIANGSPPRNGLTFKCNSPKRNKFYTVFNPNVETASLEKSSNAQVGYKKTNNEVTFLVNNKQRHNGTIQSEPINNNKMCCNNQQNPKNQDNLELKLQVIGLTQKKSFVKVLEPDIVEDFSNESKIINTAETSALKNEGRNPLLLGNIVNRENKKENYLPTKQNNINKQHISYGGDIKNTFNSFKIEKYVEDSSQIPIEGLSTESRGDYAPMAIKTLAMKQEQSMCSLDKKEDVKQNKEKFVAILPAVETYIVETNSNAETSKPTYLLEQAAKKKEEVSVYSEVGVQTDFPITQIRKKNEIPFEMVNDVSHAGTNDSNINPLKVSNNINKNLFNQNFKRVENDKKLLIPAKRGSFVHIVNNQTNRKINNCDNIPDFQEHISSIFNKATQNSLPNKSKILNQLTNEKQPGEHLMNKINAIYEFLQYLDKILQNTALIKQSNVCEETTNNMGNLNKTLRCLCSNCIEILNKIEVNQLMKQEHSKCFKSPEKSGSTQYTKKRSQFVSQVSPQRELEWRKDDESNVEYVNISEVEQPVEYSLQREFLEPKTHKWNPKPFFVVVPSNETLGKKSIHEGDGDVLKQSFEPNQKFKNVIDSTELYFQMEDEIDNMLLKKKINNNKSPKIKVNNSEILYNREQENEKIEKRFKKRTVDEQNRKDKLSIDMCDKNVRERDCSVKGLYTKTIESRPEKKFSSFETLPHCSRKYKNVDNKFLLQGNHTINKAAIRRGKPIKSVNSDSSLDVRFKNTVHLTSFAVNNQIKNNEPYICSQKCFGDSMAYLQSSESKMSVHTYEQDVDSSKHDMSNNEISYSHFGNGLERKMKQCYYDKNVTDKKDLMKREDMATKVLSRNQLSQTYVPYFLSTTRKMCKSTTIKNSEKLLTGSVSKNKQAVKQNKLNNNTKIIHNTLDKTDTQTAILHCDIYTKEETQCHENPTIHNRSDSKASIHSCTLTDSLDKSIVYKNQTMLKTNMEPKCLQNEFLILTNRNGPYQLMDKPFLKANQEKHAIVLENKVPTSDHRDMSTTNVRTGSQDKIPKCTETRSRNSSKFSLKSLDSNSSIDSLFSQNKETLVFVNRHLPCNKELNISNISCNCKKEMQEQTEGISNEYSGYDSQGWISISNCELHNNNNKNAILNNSVLSNDPDRVRLQMDIKLNDIMHVEFVCQPSDPEKLHNKQM